MTERIVEERLMCPECDWFTPRRSGAMAPESWRGVRQRLFKHQRKAHADTVEAELARKR